MSTTDVAGSVTPVYTPTLLVTNDASILTQADLTTLVVSLANRIEFLRQLVGISSSNFSGFKEDFLHIDEDAVAFGTPREWHGDTMWRVVQQGAGTLSLTNDDPGNTVNHGMLTIMSTSGTTGAMFYKDKGTGSRGVRFSSLIQTTCICRIQNASAPMKFEFGLKAGASPGIDAANAASITFLFDPTINANWLAKTSLNAAASAHYTDTGVPPVPGGGFQKLEIVRTATGPQAFNWLINGAVVASKTQNSVLTPFVPATDAAHMCFGGQVPTVTVSDETIDVDFISFDLTSTGR
jgi:hypothetical protein